MRALAQKSSSDGSRNASPLARPASAAAPAPNGLVPQLEHPSVTFDFSRVPARTANAPPALQTKLAVGGAGDEFEREADSVAEQVMRMPGQSQRPAAGFLRAPAATAQTKPGPSGGTSSPLRAPAIVNDVLRSSGQPLDTATRAFMEPRFGHDFSNVRVHTDEKAARSAAAISARAYTYGNDIVLGAGSPDTAGHLMAHELAHVRQQQAGGALAVRRSRLPTHFGEFEDVSYQNLTDNAGHEIGVEMYMKFHPGPSVRADLIGTTQSAEGKFNGTQITSGNYGQHSATSGAGTGSFIDRVEGAPNPLSNTPATPVAGGDAAKLADYQPMAPVTALTAPQQATTATAIGATGRHYSVGAQYGFSKVVAGALTTQPAEFYDAPMVSGAGANSEQVFETTALAVAGTQNGTYYGSVEWGWRKDAAGAFTRLPFRVIAQGIPSATFLTAASIWNPSKASFGYVTTRATNLLDAAMHTLTALPNNSELTPTGTQEKHRGITYYEVTFNDLTGFVASTAVREASIGTETVNLPVPIVFTVSNPAGTSMIYHSPPIAPPPGTPPATLALPAGTRLTTTRCMKPTAALPNHYEGEVVDGPNIGTHGYFFVPDLTRETLGTH